MEDNKWTEFETIKHIENILRLWLVDNNKPATLTYYNKLPTDRHLLIIDALRDVISQSENEEFRKAADDIPKYITLMGIKYY